MSNLDIIRAWKDVEYRESLSAEQRALLPQHPALELALRGFATPAHTDGSLNSHCTPCTAAPTGYASDGSLNSHCTPCTAAPTGYASDGSLNSHCTPCTAAPTGYV